MGKSSLVKAAHARINRAAAQRLKLVEIHREDIESLPALMALLRDAPWRVVVFGDELSFDGGLWSLHYPAAQPSPAEGVSR